MLNKIKMLQGYKLDCLDGEIGQVKEFYFDDQSWAIRYLVAETGNWLTGRQVLISPRALGGMDKEKKRIAIDLTKKQIENSPALDSDKPVSRQFEEAYYGYYGWATYWGTDPYTWNAGASTAKNCCGKNCAPNKSEKSLDPHLRSSKDVMGHHIQTTDGEIGHVADMILDDELWVIRYLIIDTQNWWPGKKVLLASQWVERISWEDSKVFINLPREIIKLSPAYTDDFLLTRDYESQLYRHYNRQAYWLGK